MYLLWYFVQKSPKHSKHICVHMCINIYVSLYTHVHTNIRMGDTIYGRIHRTFERGQKGR